MAEENSNDDVCGFLDTFFDDGVLEAIEDVLGSPQSNAHGDDSSCEALDTNVNNTTVKVQEEREKCLSASLESQLSKEESKETCGSKDRIIILKPAHLKDPLQQLKSASHKKISHDFSKESTGSVAAGLEVKSDRISNKCALPEKTTTLVAASKSQKSNDKTEESIMCSPMDQLLERVKKILKDVPVTDIKDSDVDKNQSGPLAQEREKKDLVAMVKKCLTDPPVIGLATEKMTSANDSDKNQIIVPSDSKDSESTVSRTESDVISTQTVVVQEECELLENNTPCLSPVENSAVKASLESVAEAQRNEKELSLEDTCSDELKQISPAKQNKININLKTQILAPTSVLKPESLPKASVSVKKRTYSRSSRPRNKEVEPSSPDPGKKKTETSFPECADKLSAFKEPCSPSSSISNDSLTDGVTIRRKKDKKGRKRESSVSGLSDSSDDLRSKHKRSRKKRKDSPVERRKRGKSRKTRDSRKRSLSRSRSPHKTSRRRARSPKSYRKRRRTYSRSPSPLCNRRFPRKHSRSPRRRSRSKSPVYSRTRKAQSPSDHRKRKSRSKSPFINEICRLKKQWEKEDEAKKDRYGHVQPKRFLPHIPSWTQETNSATIVSNMAAISVSVESVQVHSASFSFGNTVDGRPPAFPVGLPPGSASLSFGAHFGLPDYSIHPNESLYPMTVPAPPVLAPASVVDPPSTYDQGTASCKVQPHPQICASQPQTVLSLPPIPGIGLSSETTSTNPPTSMLRKQLDILMTSVAPTLSDPITSHGNNSTVQITNQSKEKSVSVSENQSSEETGINVVPPSNPPSEQGAGKECTRSVEKEHKLPLGSEKNAENEKPRNTLNNAGNLSSDKDLLGIHEVEEYDSDVIIEDPPPKAPVELVCLSADEMDSKCPLYDLDKELNKIDKDTKELNELEKGGGEATPEPTETLSRRKRKRKKKSKSKESSREKTKNPEMKCNESPDVDFVEDPTEISDDSSDSMILRECREMIDSLRIGRFVFINDDDNDDKTIDEAAAADPEDSNSVLYSSGVQFSYTKRPTLNLEPKTKNISTNTPIHLLIDVCCGNENNVVQNDFGVQVTSECRGCIEKKDVIRELNTQLLALKKERDRLLSIVCDIGSSSQKIPGLDIPVEPQADAAKGNSVSVNQSPNSHLMNTRAVVNSIQSESNSWCLPNVRSTAVTPQDMQASSSCEPYLKERTMSVVSRIHEITTLPVFYDYNHSSPVPTEVLSHTGLNEYLSSKRPFQ